MDVAVTAPLVAVLPCTTAQSPTFAAELVELTSVVYIVLELKVTVRKTVLAAAPAAARRDCCTVTVVPLTFVTLPKTNPPKAPRFPRAPPGAPDGRLVDMPDGAPLRRMPPVRGPPPLNPAEQVPFFVALTRTVEAATGAVVEVDAPDPEAEAGVDPAAELVTETHEPTLTAAALVAAVRVNFVDAAYMTAVCSEVFCTCRVDPLRAAISPDAADPAPRPVGAPAAPVPAEDPAAGAAELAVLPELPELPHAARAAAASTAVPARTTRAGEVRCFIEIPISLVVQSRCADEVRSARCAGQSLRRASIGASRAARVAG
ncbi:hypothetical protein [uncultured Jatrophihabitans sp.]|uniref:hypothetical protein n=1 Tax=uncultured Jatrophihabitans sp. TaxID=1610747 RepID=UPI0035C99A52